MKIEFKPFDRILVKNKVWKCAFFSNYVHSKDGNPTPIVETTNGDVYHKDSCLPYEGNDELLGTDKTAKSNRWRAIVGDIYYLIDNELEVAISYEHYNSVDDRRWQIGNYFKTIKDAEAVAKEFQKILEHYEQGKIGLEQHDLGTCPTENDTKPTKEQLVKALKIFADYGDCDTYTDEGNAEIIIQHWNDD